MSNFLIRSCDNVVEIVVDDNGNTITTGTTYFIEFTGASNSMCYTIIEESINPPTDGINSLTGYSNCLECLQQNDLGFFVVSCNYPELGGPVNATQFNQWPIGQFYQLCTDRDEFLGFTNEKCLCFEVSGISSSYEYNFTILGPFENCTCTMSAGTEYFVCQICGDTTGSTATQIAVPHPTWSRPDGIDVVQLSAVQLGGMFGLNS